MISTIYNYLVAVKETFASVWDTYLLMFDFFPPIIQTMIYLVIYFGIALGLFKAISSIIGRVLGLS